LETGDKTDNYLGLQRQLLVQAGSADINEMRQAFGFKNIDIGGRMIKAVDKLLHGPVSCCK